MGNVSKRAVHLTTKASLSVSLGVLVFNNGMQHSLSELMPMVHFQVHSAMQKGWQRIDKKRMWSVDYIAQPSVKKRWKKLKREKCKKQAAFAHREDATYKSSARGIFKGPSPYAKLYHRRMADISPKYGKKRNLR